MKLSELVAQYVSHKRALGMRFDSEVATLASFCHRVDGNIDVESVTVDGTGLPEWQQAAD
jgi:hypothetical protein